MDIRIGPNELPKTSPGNSNSTLVEFGQKILAAAQWLAPAKIAERRRLDALASTAVKAIHAALDNERKPHEAASILDNAWEACGSEGFSWAMGKTSWTTAGLPIPPVHAAIAVRDPRWALKLAAMAPAGAWHIEAHSKNNWFGTLSTKSRLKASHHPKTIGSALALCDRGSHLDFESWQAIAALMARDGVRAPQGDDLVLAQHILDESRLVAQKNALRSWAQSDQIAAAAPHPAAEPSRKPRSL